MFMFMLVGMKQKVGSMSWQFLAPEHDEEAHDKTNDKRHNTTKRMNKIGNRLQRAENERYIYSSIVEKVCSVLPRSERRALSNKQM
jgi:hypothetical protein